MVDYPSTGWYDNLRPATATVAVPMRASPSHKSRLVAGCLGLLVPGWGRFYIGDSQTGNRYLGAWLLGLVCCLSLVLIHIGLPLMVYGHIASAVDSLLILALGMDYRETR